jgi:hypothetical protein
LGHEARDLDATESCGDEGVDEAELVLRWDRGALVLEAVPRRDLVDRDAVRQVIEHTSQDCHLLGCAKVGCLAPSIAFEKEV